MTEVEKHYRDLIEKSTHGLVLEMRLDGGVQFVNEAFCRVTGYASGEIIGTNFFSYLHPKDTAEILKHYQLLQESKKPIYNCEYRLRKKDGGYLYLLVNADPIFDEEELKSVLQISFDISERKKAEAEKERAFKELLKVSQKFKSMTLKDYQTGLYNHLYLADIIEAEFYRARRQGGSLATIMLDIDYFKSINDVYGYQFGDLVLRQLAKLLKKMVRRYDIIVRFGGEEFVIISSGIDRVVALTLGRRLLDTINLYNFGDKKHTVKLKLSVAVAVYPEDNVIKGMDLIELNEDILSEVKEYGGNNVYSSLDRREKRAFKIEKSKESEEVIRLKQKVDRLTKRANQNLVEAVFAFARTIEFKDRYTGEHAERTVYYATEIAHKMGLPKYEIENIKQAAILHDLGKVGISERILQKKSKLTEKEFNEIKKHPQIAVDIICPIQFLHGIIPMVFSHHERWDGKGYPHGLKGKEIPVGARIIAVADVFQALTSNRPYRKAYPRAEAIRIIKEGAGTQFDSKIVDIFLQVLKEEKC